MTQFSQQNQPIRAVSILGPDALLLRGFVGGETISRPFGYTVDLLSENATIDGEALLQTPLRLDITLDDGSTRYIHGLIKNFVQLGRHDALVSYRAEVVPWFWFLQLGSDCRVFQGKTVLEIVQKLFREFGFADYRIACTARYPEREYCVQYRETHFAFISRLLEEEGISYYFSHEASRHVMVLTDGPTGFARAPLSEPVEYTVADARAMPHDVITALAQHQAVHPGQVTVRNYDPLQPSLTLEGSAGKAPRMEHFDYGLKFTKVNEGQKYAKMRLEELECMRRKLLGEGNARAFTAGHRFFLKGHYRSDFNREYTLVSVEHACEAGDYLSGGMTEMQYRNRFTAIPSDVPYRPPRATQQPLVRGTQSALVVGPVGQRHEIDNHARVKIQFYWDRRGKRDEKSSCWVRVASPWASKGYGGVSHPRIGDEVIVDFFEGDPDQPIIVGRAYNAERTPPYPLPAGANKSGLRSQSGNGYNEVVVDDSDGGEGVTIHAQYNMGTRVNNDAQISVGNNLTEVVGVNATEQVGNNKTTVVTNASVTSADTILLNAATSITLKCGASVLHMNQAGFITISGTVVTTAASICASMAAPITTISGALVTSVQSAMLWSGSLKTRIDSATAVTVSASKINLNA